MTLDTRVSPGGTWQEGLDTNVSPLKVRILDTKAGRSYVETGDTSDKGGVQKHRWRLSEIDSNFLNMCAWCGGLLVGARAVRKVPKAMPSPSQAAAAMNWGCLLRRSSQPL